MFRLGVIYLYFFFVIYFCGLYVFSLAHKSDFAGHVIVTTGLLRMHFPRPRIFLRWNSNLQQVDFSQGFA